MKVTRKMFSAFLPGGTILFLVVSALVGHANAASVINFDGLTSGTKVGTQFQIDGAVFLTVDTTGIVFSDAEVLVDPSEASSGPNILIGGDPTFTCFGTTCSESPIFIDIVETNGSPTSTNGVCFQLISVGHAQVTVTALDAGDIQLGDTVSVVNPGGPVNGLANQDLIELGHFGIARVSIAIDSPGVFVDGYGIDDVEIGCAVVVEVSIDIKPGSDPNCFNINGHGVIPVAILGSDSFDVSNINQATLSFGGLVVRVRGNKGPFCGSEDTNNDGFPDLVCQFVDDSTVWEPGTGDATLSGSLLDGTMFEGTDLICVVP